MTDVLGSETPAKTKRTATQPKTVETNDNINNGLSKNVKWKQKTVAVITGIGVIGFAYNGFTKFVDKVQHGSPAIDVAKAAGVGTTVGCTVISRDGTESLVTAVIDPEKGTAQQITYNRGDEDDAEISVALVTKTAAPKYDDAGNPVLDADGKPVVDIVEREGDSIDVTDNGVNTITLRTPTANGKFTEVTLRVSRIERTEDGQEALKSNCQAGVAVLGR